MAELEDPRATMTLRHAGSDTVLVTMAGEFDVASVADLRAEIDSVLQVQARGVVVDASELAFMDSSGLAVLLRFADRFGPIRIDGARPIIRRLVQIAGVGELLVVADGPAS